MVERWITIIDEIQQVQPVGMVMCRDGGSPIAKEHQGIPFGGKATLKKKKRATQKQHG